MQISGIGAWSGGTVVDLAVCGDTVLAATFAGIVRSTDGGRSWHPVGRALPDWFVQAVALSSAGAQAVGLAASHMGWLYRSTDGGETWETLSYWRNLGITTRLVMSPNFEADGVVFACTEENGIWKSTDRGNSWKPANFGLLNLNAAALCFSPDFARDEVVFAGTDGGGLFRSRNAGRAWRESGEGIPDSAVQCLAISPHFGTDGVVLAGTEERGIYRSQDGGRTWDLLGASIAESCINGLYLSPDWAAGGSVVAATDDGLLLSADGGQTWRASQGAPDYPYVVVSGGEGLLAGVYEEGIYRSVEGDIWSPSNENLSAHLPPVVCFSGAFERDRTLLMASMEGTMVRSSDGGQTWTSLLGEEDVGVSAFTGTGEGGSMALLAAAESVVLCSRDSGDTWAAAVNTGQDPLSALAISANYDRDRCMVAGTTGGQVLLSIDGGTSWRHMQALGEMVVALAARTVSGRREVYAVTARAAEDGSSLLTLHKGGDWQALQSRAASEPVAVLRLVGENDLLCSLGKHILYLEADAWVAENELDGPASVSCLEVSGEAFLAGTRWGLSCSTDRAQSWAWLTSELSVVALHAMPDDPQQVVVVSMGGRMWQVDVS